ncbi:hypothetical protein ACFSTC_50445 [Nonomuraea ferruginea]
MPIRSTAHRTRGRRASSAHDPVRTGRRRVPRVWRGPDLLRHDASRGHPGGERRVPPGPATEPHTATPVPGPTATAPVRVERNDAEPALVTGVRFG